MSKYRTQILDYINQYNGKISKHALAKLIYTENKDVYRDTEHVRGLVRQYTGSLGIISSVKSVEWNVPKGEVQNYSDFMMPLSASNLLLLPDMHFPFHNEKHIQKSLETGYKQGCNAILMTGDQLDCHQISNYDKNRDFKDMYEEVQIFIEFIDNLKKSWDVPIYFKMGNHEDRWDRLLRQYPQLHLFDEFQLSTILKFGQYGITEIKSKQEIKCGEFSLWHGHELFGSGGDIPAKTMLMKTFRSGACGHFHRISQYKAHNGTKDIEFYSMGTLGELRPDFMPHQKATQTWDNGFGVLQWDKKHFEFQNIKLKNK
jgi:hypothetical protein